MAQQPLSAEFQLSFNRYIQYVNDNVAAMTGIWEKLEAQNIVYLGGTPADHQQKYPKVGASEISYEETRRDNHHISGPIVSILNEMRDELRYLLLETEMLSDSLQSYVAVANLNPEYGLKVEDFFLRCEELFIAYHGVITRMRGMVKTYDQHPEHSIRKMLVYHQAILRLANKGDWQGWRANWTAYRNYLDNMPGQSVMLTPAGNNQKKWAKKWWEAEQQLFSQLPPQGKQDEAMLYEWSNRIHILHYNGLKGIEGFINSWNEQLDKAHRLKLLHIPPYFNMRNQLPKTQAPASSKAQSLVLANPKKEHLKPSTQKKPQQLALAPVKSPRQKPLWQPVLTEGDAPALIHEERFCSGRSFVLLLDISSSMGKGNKWELFQELLEYMIRDFEPNDHISIITYAGGARRALKPMHIEARNTVRSAVNRLKPGGETEFEAGLKMAYETANIMSQGQAPAFVLWITDGAFNLKDKYRSQVQREADARRYLHILSIGNGVSALNKTRFRKFAQMGGGSYIPATEDDMEEAFYQFMGGLPELGTVRRE